MEIDRKHQDLLRDQKPDRMFVTFFVHHTTGFDGVMQRLSMSK